MKQHSSQVSHEELEVQEEAGTINLFLFLLPFRYTN